VLDNPFKVKIPFGPHSLFDYWNLPGKHGAESRAKFSEEAKPSGTHSLAYFFQCHYRDFVQLCVRNENSAAEIDIHKYCVTVEARDKDKQDSHFPPLYFHTLHHRGHIRILSDSTAWFNGIESLNGLYLFDCDWENLAFLSFHVRT
jgi:hypothetical protein